MSELRLKMVPDTGHMYMAGSDGSIWSLYNANHGKREEWKRLKPTFNAERGYYAVMLKISGKWKTRFVHAVILTTFEGPRLEGYECRHLDGNPLNNCLDNLRWGTPAENGEDRILHGRIKRRRGCVTTEHEEYAVRKFAETGMPLLEVARLAEVPYTTVNKVLKGKGRFATPCPKWLDYLAAKGKSPLSREEVRKNFVSEVKLLRENGMPVVDIAKKMNVHRSTVGRALRESI